LAAVEVTGPGQGGDVATVLVGVGEKTGGMREEGKRAAELQ
jgi:hypothetical protein